MPGATAGARAARARKAGSDATSLAGADGSAVGALGATAAEELPWRVSGLIAAPHAHARRAKGSASRTRRDRGRRDRMRGFGCIDGVHAAATFELDSAVDEEGGGVEVADHLAGGVDLD